MLLGCVAAAELTLGQMLQMALLAWTRDEYTWHSAGRRRRWLNQRCHLGRRLHEFSSQLAEISPRRFIITSARRALCCRSLCHYMPAAYR